MSGLDKVRVGFAVARAAYGRRAQLLEQLAADVERLQQEVSEVRAENWRLRDEREHWGPPARTAWPLLDVNGERGGGR